MSKRMSIHIGIDRYDRAMYGNADLKQCVRDATAMYEMFYAMGFVPLCIFDADATRAMYLQTMREYAEELEAGDTLVFSQSSHGTYMDTPNGRATGLCFHDAPLWDFEQKDVWKWFKPGVRIIRIIDCCFAESNFRFAPGMSKQEGTPRTVTVKKAITIKPSSGSLRSCKATIISLSSSNVMEFSYENTDGGVFTQALQAELQNDIKTPYSKLLREVRKTIKLMGYPQTPKMESVKAGKYQKLPFASFTTKPQ